MTTTAPPRVSPADLSARLAAGRVTVLDVRSPGEYAAAAIADSAHLPLDQLDAHADRLARDIIGPVALVCRSGQRAQQAADRLTAAGVHELVVLDGGLNAWEAEGHPVRRGRGKWELERQVRLTAGGIVLGGVLASLRWPRARFLSGAVGAGLTFAAVSDTCAMGKALLKLPYNQVPATSTEQALARLSLRR